LAIVTAILSDSVLHCLSVAISYSDDYRHLSYGDCLMLTLVEPAFITSALSDKSVHPWMMLWLLLLHWRLFRRAWNSILYGTTLSLQRVWRVLARVMVNQCSHPQFFPLRSSSIFTGFCFSDAVQTHYLNFQGIAHWSSIISY